MIIAETRMKEIPDNCFKCDLFQRRVLKCPAKNVHFATDARDYLRERKPNWCPLREVEIKNVRVVEGKENER